MLDGLERNKARKSKKFEGATANMIDAESDEAPKQYDLDAVLALARELGFSALHTPHDCTVGVELLPEVILEFTNVPDRNDTIAGFAGGFGWHWHDDLYCVTSDHKEFSLDELDVLVALKDGQLLVVDRIRRDGELVDRWLHHVSESLDLDDVSRGAELKIRSVVQGPERI